MLNLSASSTSMQSKTSPFRVNPSENALTWLQSSPAGNLRSTCQAECCVDLLGFISWSAVASQHVHVSTSPMARAIVSVLCGHRFAPTSAHLREDCKFYAQMLFKSSRNECHKFKACLMQLCWCWWRWWLRRQRWWCWWLGMFSYLLCF